MDSRAETLAGDNEPGSTSPIPSINEKLEEFNGQITDTDREKSDSGDHRTDIDVPASEEKTAGDDTAAAKDDVEYPSGVRLAAIVVALLLSIFLVSQILLVLHI